MAKKKRISVSERCEKATRELLIARRADDLDAESSVLNGTNESACWNGERIDEIRGLLKNHAALVKKAVDARLAQNPRGREAYLHSPTNADSLKEEFNLSNNREVF
jgi:hypothetical protein